MFKEEKYRNTENLKCYNLSIQHVILFNYILNENILQENREDSFVLFT